MGATISSPEKAQAVFSESTTYVRASAVDCGTQVTLDDARVIRDILVASMEKSGASRATIADLMSDSLVTKVTENMLNRYAAESRGHDCRWPAQWDRAFCKATGDNTLIRRRAEMAGLHVADAQERALADLGRAILQREQADARIASLREQLKGVQL